MTAMVVGAELFKHTTIIGGFIDRDVTELAVMPCGPSGLRVVITVTPLAR
jgi:hypothetical protein